MGVDVSPWLSILCRICLDHGYCSMISVLSLERGVYSDCGDDDHRLGSVLLFADRLACVQSGKNNGAMFGGQPSSDMEKVAKGISERQKTKRR